MFKRFVFLRVRQRTPQPPSLQLPADYLGQPQAFLWFVVIWSSSADFPLHRRQSWLVSQPRCSTSAGRHLLPRNLLVVPLVDMQVPNPELTSRQGTVTEHSGSFDIRPTRAYVYDHGSPSGSEIDDAGNLVYSDPNKMDTDLDGTTLVNFHYASYYAPFLR